MITRALPFLGICLFFAVTLHADTVVHVQKSKYNDIYVVDQGSHRYLRFDSATGDDQSMMSLSNRHAIPMEYIRYMLLATYYYENPKNFLMIGLGGGTLVSYLRQINATVSIHAVEIDPAIVEVAKKFFFLGDDLRVHTHIDDGYHFLQNEKRVYDLIAIDAYTGKGFPAHLKQVSFFQLVKSHLSAHGIGIINIAADDKQEEQQVMANIKKVFKYAHCAYCQTSANIVMIVGTKKIIMEQDTLVRRAQKIASEYSLNINYLNSFIEHHCNR